jgi:hypothetical protein
MNLINTEYDGNVAAAKAYFLRMIDNTFAGSSPFGYVTVQFEWSWCYQEGDTSHVSDWIQTLLSKRSYYDYWTFEDAVNWFKANYNQTPTYRIEFTSPYNGQQIEWYYSLSNRVARSGNNVVSYVDYTDQQPDKYLNSSATIFWKSPSSPTNGIDDSLTFKIDALGGGYLRAPVTTSSFPYTGDLQFFTQFFETHYTEMTPVDNLTQQKIVLCSTIFVALGTIVAIFMKTRVRRARLDREQAKRAR